MKIVFAVALTALALLPSRLAAQVAEEDNGKGVRLGEPIVQRWQVGAIIQSTGGEAQGIFATIPVPTDWLEQRVRLVDEEFSRNIGSVDYRTIDGGVRQMVITIPRIVAGDEARALLTFEVSTCPVLAPEDTSLFVIPRRAPRAVLSYLSTSPFINSRHNSIRRQAAELRDDELSAWAQVERIYDWVREEIEYENGELKGAVDALQDRSGNGEDLVSLFIALCRANRIPARTVWVHGHYYAEFYLEDDEGVGHWFPCQVAGNRDFGSMSDVRPILQKGDNFQVPEKTERQRFVPELLKVTRAATQPRVQFVRELLPNE